MLSYVTKCCENGYTIFFEPNVLKWHGLAKIHFVIFFIFLHFWANSISSWDALCYEVWHCSCDIAMTESRGILVRIHKIHNSAHVVPMRIQIRLPTSVVWSQYSQRTPQVPRQYIWTSEPIRSCNRQSSWTRWIYMWQFPVCHRFIRTYQKCVAPCTRQISPTWLRPVHLGSDLIPLMPVLAPTRETIPNDIQNHNTLHWDRNSFADEKWP